MEEERKSFKRANSSFKSKGGNKKINSLLLPKLKNLPDILNIENAIHKTEEKELEGKINTFFKNQESNSEDKGDIKEYITSLFSQPFFAEIFFAWCKDCEDKVSVENAKFFRQELILRENKDDKNFNFHSMRVSKNFLVSFSGNIPSNTINKLDLSDNLITDICLHNIKSLISNKKIAYLNLSSNMISTEGLKIIHNELINSDSLVYLNLGIYEGSFRRNNFSGDGGLLLAKILLTNESIKTLVLQDNELGEDAGDKLGSALIQNKTLRVLKIAENKIKNKGAKSIIENAHNLTSLDLSNNDISPEVCFDLQKLLISSKVLEELVWNSNNIGIKGISTILEGVQSSFTLKKLSLQNTNIGNTGVKILTEGLIGNQTLQELDLSSNAITLEGFIPICECLISNHIKKFKCKNNLLGDDSMKYFANLVLASDEFPDKPSSSQRKSKVKLESFDFSSSKIYDQGLIYLLYKLKDNTTIRSIKLKDNYFTHEVDTLLIEYLDKNKTLTKLNLDKNRLSILCLKKVEELIERNKKIQNEKEPNRLLVELYRLKYENTRLDEMKDSLRYMENNLEKIKLNKNDIRQDYDNFKRICDEEYEELNSKLTKTQWNYDKLTKEKETIIKELQYSKDKNNMKLKEVEGKKEDLNQKKMLLLKTLEDMKVKFVEDEKDYITTYDKLRTEIFDNQEKIKFFNDTNKIFSQIKEAEKKIKEMKKAGKIKEGN